MISLHEYRTSRLDDSSIDNVVVAAYDYSKVFDTLKFNHIINSLADLDNPLDTSTGSSITSGIACNSLYER